MTQNEKTGTLKLTTAEIGSLDETIDLLIELKHRLNQTSLVFSVGNTVYSDDLLGRIVNQLSDIASAKALELIEDKWTKIN